MCLRQKRQTGSATPFLELRLKTDCSAQEDVHLGGPGRRGSEASVHPLRDGQGVAASQQRDQSQGQGKRTNNPC